MKIYMAVPRKVVIFTLAVCLVASTIMAQKPDTRWYSANPGATVFTISTADELAGLPAIVNGKWDGTPAVDNFAGKTIKLTANINLSAYKNWEPIGQAPPTSNLSDNLKGVFAGIFDGGAHAITNLTINRPDIRNVGLFGYIGEGGRVKNLGLDRVNIHGHIGVGGLAGEVARDGIVENCYSIGIVNGASNVGGVAGTLSHHAAVNNCYSAGTVSGTNGSIGGIVGRTIGYRSGVGGGAGSAVICVVNNSYSSATVNTTDGVAGGVVGYLKVGLTFNSYSTGNVSSRAGSAGGVVGEMDFSVVANCYATGAISGTKAVGGIAGAGLNGGRVINCAALNPSIKSSSSTEGRVIGGTSLQAARTGTYLHNNVAYVEMTNNAGDTRWTNRGGTDKDGVGITASEIKNDGTIGARFNKQDFIGVFWEAEPVVRIGMWANVTGKGWTIENGRLPGHNGSAVNWPNHLK